MGSEKYQFELHYKDYDLTLSYPDPARFHKHAAAQGHVAAHLDTEKAVGWRSDYVPNPHIVIYPTGPGSPGIRSIGPRSEGIIFRRPDKDPAQMYLNPHRMIECLNWAAITDKTGQPVIWPDLTQLFDEMKYDMSHFIRTKYTRIGTEMVRVLNL